MTEPLFESNVVTLHLAHRGKVRDIYHIDDEHMLIVTSDRLSAFDVVLPTPITGKGEILTAISNFWFKRMRPVIPNHLASLPLEDVLADTGERELLKTRSMVVRKLKALPIEAVVRGYLIGSGWKDYERERAVCGIKLPCGLQLADRLPEPIFTPSSKAAVGSHDTNIGFGQVTDLLGRKLAQRMRAVSIEMYIQAADYARERGIIIADTKFEFGLDSNGQLVLIDEALTPDSSRFWPSETYRAGTSPPSFDKQFVRDYLETLAWDKTAPGPVLPPEIVEKTAEKYQRVKVLLIDDARHAKASRR